jgi:hypothetical protein
MDPVEIYPEFPESLGLERFISAGERDAIPEEDFAWPEEKKYPITSQKRLDSAATLIGHAPEDKQGSIKERAISIAKRKGFSLPESWQEDKKDDNAERSEQSEYHALYMPISYMSRRDADEWIVEGQATAEVPDTYGTIFTYEASKKAFQKWYSKYANVREMHGKNAVGKGFDVNYDDANKRILVRTRVSKAEPGVWTKFHEGVLNGFSVGASPNYKLGRMSYQGKTYPAITEYDLAELSYVDAPSTPGSDAYIVARAVEGQEFVLSELIDDSDPEPPAEPATTQETIQAVETADLERAGKTISSTSQKSIHAGVSGALKGAKAMMDLCASSGCESCAKASSMIDPDNDGDVDWLNIDNPDQAEDEQMQRMQRLVEPVLERSLSPVYQRQQTFLARLSQFDNNYTEIQEKLLLLDTILAQFGEMKATLERSVSSTGINDEVRAELSAVKDLMQRVADTPMPGGPVLNGASRPQAYDKSIPYGNPQTPVDAEEVRRQTIEEMQRSGVFTTMEQQIAASAMKLKSMPMMPPTRI